MNADPTPKQAAVMQYALDAHEATGFWPTYREILTHFGWHSTNYVWEILDALEKKGLVEMRKNRGYRVLP